MPVNLRIRRFSHWHHQRLGQHRLHVALVGRVAQLDHAARHLIGGYLIARQALDGDHQAGDVLGGLECTLQYCSGVDLDDLDVGQGELGARLQGAVGVVLAEPLMRLAGADADVLPLAVRYARILFAGLIAMEMVPSVSGMLNAAGAPGVGLTMRLWSLATMLVAEPLLVGWLGLAGAALALVGSNAVGMLWGLGVLLVGRAPVRIDVRHLRLDLGMMRRILAGSVSIR